MVTSIMVQVFWYTGGKKKDNCLVYEMAGHKCLRVENFEDYLEEMVLN
jgi:hypothetical protein